VLPALLPRFGGGGGGLGPNSGYPRTHDHSRYRSHFGSRYQLVACYPQSLFAPGSWVPHLRWTPDAGVPRSSEKLGPPPQMDTQGTPDRRGPDLDCGGGPKYGVQNRGAGGVTLKASKFADPGSPTSDGHLGSGSPTSDGHPGDPESAGSGFGLRRGSKIGGLGGHP